MKIKNDDPIRMRPAPPGAEVIAQAAYRSLKTDNDRLRSQLDETKRKLHAAELKERTTRHDLEGEIAGLKEALRAEGKIPPWDLAKVARQRAANDHLTRRNTRLRFQLREITRLGRALTTEEFLAAKHRQQEDRGEADQEMLDDRIGKPGSQNC